MDPDSPTYGHIHNTYHAPFVFIFYPNAKYKHSQNHNFLIGCGGGGWLITGAPIADNR